MKRILVGVDGSKESLQAALLAANLAHQTHRSIELAHVLPDAVPMPPEAFSTELATWRKEIAEEGTKLLKEVRDRVDRPETEARSTLVESARPAEALAEMAKVLDAEGIAIGRLDDVVLSPSGPGAPPRARIQIAAIA